MTIEQRAIWTRLQHVTMPVASYDKRFRRISPDTDLSERQAAYLLKLDHRYRRQTGGAHACTPFCATYGRRRTGECFDAPLAPKETPADRRFLASIGIAAKPPAPLPLFDDPDPEKRRLAL